MTVFGANLKNSSVGGRSILAICLNELKTQENSSTKFVELIFLNAEEMCSEPLQTKKETFVWISTHLPGKTKSILFSPREKVPRKH